MRWCIAIVGHDQGSGLNAIAFEVRGQAKHVFLVVRNTIVAWDTREAFVNEQICEPTDNSACRLQNIPMEGYVNTRI